MAEGGYNEKNESGDNMLETGSNQCFSAIGENPAVYIYYKNVNRVPTTHR
jgi:glyoxylate utilization-related uncharacterized protein